MRQGTLVLALIAVVSLSGCVWKSDYKKSLAEIEGLQKVRAGLEEKSAAQERKIAELTQQKETLEKDKAGLMQENENIKSTLETKRDKLANEVVGLKNRLGDNANHIAELEQQIARLSEEKTKAVEEKERAIARMKNTYESLVNEMKQEIKEGEIQITQLKDRLTVNLVDKILFDSGSAAIKGKGQKVLDRVGEILKTVTDRQIKVEGHTDNVPISAALAEKFPSNWELSTARATTVVRYLQGRGVDPTFLSAEGYGEFQPVAPNDTDESKAKNRRIEIVLIPREVSP